MKWSVLELPITCILGQYMESKHSDSDTRYNTKHTAQAHTHTCTHKPNLSRKPEMCLAQLVGFYPSIVQMLPVHAGKDVWGWLNVVCRQERCSVAGNGWGWLFIEALALDSEVSLAWIHSSCMYSVCLMGQSTLYTLNWESSECVQLCVASQNYVSARKIHLWLLLI